MGLNRQKGNMYGFVTHTWNTVKGECSHDCSYCYMKRWGTQNPVRFDEKELKTDLGVGHTVFVGSSNDMFAQTVPDEWIEKTLSHCKEYPNNWYLFQTKNPMRYGFFSRNQFPKNTVLCSTIETNRTHPEIMGNTPSPAMRAGFMREMVDSFYTMITIEPIIDFDLDDFVELILLANPTIVAIGADTGHNNLPEPSPDKIRDLIEHLEVGEIDVRLKPNLDRI